MNTMPPRTLLSAGCATLMLAGCGSAPPIARDTEHSNRFIGNDPIYASLERSSDGRWTFGNVNSENLQPEAGFLVRLNDLTPAFDIRPTECAPKPYRDNDRCHPSNPFRKKNVGVVGRIVDSGISAGTGGKMGGVNRNYQTEFDDIAFNQAVDQALLITGLDENRQTLILGLTDLNSQIARQQREISSLVEQTKADYESDAVNNIHFDTQYSGITQYLGKELDLAEIIKVQVNSQGSLPAQLSPGPTFLPCEARRCMAQLIEARDALETDHRIYMTKLRSALQQYTSRYRLDCDENQYGGLRFRLHCPDYLERSAQMVLPVEIEILARDFHDLFPNFETRDEHIAVGTKDGQLSIENRTGEFIDVQSISIYYNSEVSTTADLGSRLDLAPFQTINADIGEFSSQAVNIESRHSDMTPSKAMRSSFSFGLAIKYSLRDKDSVATLYALDDFDLHCAISDRLRPGSCGVAGKKSNQENRRSSALAY